MTAAGPVLRVLGSMATRGLVAELAAGRDGVAAEAAGGVDVARRIRTGEGADVLILADGVMRALEAEGFLEPGSLVGVAVSTVAMAVRDGEALPDMSDAGSVRRAVEAAGRVGHSTGPSGDHVRRLLSGWGLEDRLVQAPPGVPVGRLLADGAVDLGFQQYGELMGVPGVAVAGSLPDAIAGNTVFTAGIPRSAADPDGAAGFIGVLASPGTRAAKERHGLAAP